VKTYLTRAVAVLAFLLSAGTASATNWVEGQHYFLIENLPRTAQPAGKGEVTEVFSYGCPACRDFAPIARKLKASLPPGVTFNYVHASFNAAESWPLFQRAYCTAQVLGIADKYHDAMFAAIWVNGELPIVDEATGRIHSPAPTIQDVAKFYAKRANIKADQFVETANSMTISLKMRESDAYIRRNGVDRTPTLIVNGKYRMDPSTAGGMTELIELVNWLLANKK